MNELQVVEHSGQRILTTQQLAESYGTETKTVSNNFNRNKDHYIEGKHFYCLKGEELKDFKGCHQIDDTLKATSILYLWTERGAMLHAKSLNTQTAWDVYDALVETYFKAKDTKALTDLSPQLQFLVALESKQTEHDNRIAELENLTRTIGTEISTNYDKIYNSVVYGSAAKGATRPMLPKNPFTGLAKATALANVSKETALESKVAKLVDTVTDLEEKLQASKVAQNSYKGKPTPEEVAIRAEAIADAKAARARERTFADLETRQAEYAVRQAQMSEGQEKREQQRLNELEELRQKSRALQEEKRKQEQAEAEEAAEIAEEAAEAAEEAELAEAEDQKKLKVVSPLETVDLSLGRKKPKAKPQKRITRKQNPEVYELTCTLSDIAKAHELSVRKLGQYLRRKHILQDYKVLPSDTGFLIHEQFAKLDYTRVLMRHYLRGPKGANTVACTAFTQKGADFIGGFLEAQGYKRKHKLQMKQTKIPTTQQA